MRRCAIYTRQSSVPQQQATSCNGQFERCFSYLSSQTGRGWQWIGQRLDDPGYSGVSLERPAMQALMRLAEAGQLDVVITESLDRLSSRVLDTHRLLQLFHQKGIEIHFLSNPELSMRASDNFLINLLASFAEFEHQLISERIQEYRALSKRHGRRVAGVVPFGYSADPYTKQLVPDPAEAECVRFFFEKAAAGMAPSCIAELANQRGWRTKAPRSGRMEQANGGNLWAPRQILAILANPTYLGKIRDGEGLRPGAHEALVSESLYEQVRHQLEERRTRQPGRSRIQHEWLLRGRIRCGQCGRLMSPHTTRRGNIMYSYYRCRSQTQGRPPCKAIQIGAGQLERFIMRAIVEMEPGWTSEESPERHKQLLGLRVALGLLSEASQRKLLPDLIVEVVYDPHAGRVSLSLNPEVLECFSEPDAASGQSD